MNKVILIGRLARDPELRTTPNNVSVGRFSIAVSRPFVPQNGGQAQTDFINCVVWRRQAENLARYCHKGSQIAIEGRIQTGSYTANDGSKRYTTEVLCDNITFLGTKADNQNNGGFDNNYQPNNYQNTESYQPNPYQAPVEPSSNNPVSTGQAISDNYATQDTVSTDLTDDPFKDFGEEIALTDDDLPF